MDYASLFLSRNSTKSIFPRDFNLITANQEDVDLIVAFPDFKEKNKTHLILCECKAESSWTNKQVLSKSKRFKKIFGERGEAYKDVAIPHFLLISPSKPRKLNLSQVPEFLKIGGETPWIKLDIPRDLQKITRCDENGKNKKNGSFWKVENTYLNIL